jgi:hypothetical protein
MEYQSVHHDTDCWGEETQRKDADQLHLDAAKHNPAQFVMYTIFLLLIFNKLFLSKH